MIYINYGYDYSKILAGTDTKDGLDNFSNFTEIIYLKLK